MSMEEATCLSANTGQYISDPAGPQPLHLSVVCFRKGKGDKWKGDAEASRGDYTKREEFSSLSFFKTLPSAVRTASFLLQVVRRP